MKARNVFPYFPLLEADAVSHCLCQACGLCTMVCPSNALTQEELEPAGLHNQKAPTHNADLCIHCGRCAAVCQSGTLHQQRLSALQHRVQNEKPRAVVFFCRNLQVHIPKELDSKQHSPQSTEHSACKAEPVPYAPMSLTQARRYDQVRNISLPEGVVLEIVRCVGRVGSRLLDRLVLAGLPQIMIFAGPSHTCQYSQGLSLVEAQCEGLNSVYEAYGIDARIHVIRTVPQSLRQVEEQIAQLVKA